MKPIRKIKNMEQYIFPDELLKFILLFCSDLSKTMLFFTSKKFQKIKTFKKFKNLK